LDLILATSAHEVHYFLHRDYKDTSALPTVEFDNSSTLGFSSQPGMIKRSFDSKAFDFHNLTGTGAMKVQFTRIGNDNRPDLIVSFQSGELYYYTLFDTYLSPKAVELNQSETYITFKFPTIPAGEQFDFIYADFSGDSYQDLIIFDSKGIYYTFQYNIPDGRIHYFGTDFIGGDVFSKVLLALQLDLSLAVFIVFFQEFLGIVIGSIAGYFGGWVDQLVMRISDVFFAFPGIILAMAFAAALGQSMFNLAVAFILVGWAGSARLIRGQVMSERTKLYVEAARASGLGSFRIIFRHVLPNSIYPIIVSATLGLGGVIIGFAALSFLGFGAQSGDAELGRMIADAQILFQYHPHLVFFPGLFIAAIVLGFNLLGDSIRDIMDPRLRR
jgi:peptide/nickel transport system permease protein